MRSFACWPAVDVLGLALIVAIQAANGWDRTAADAPSGSMISPACYSAVAVTG